MFYGRGALSVDLLARLGDCMPGTTGQQVVAGVYGEVPDSITFNPTLKRLPFISVGLPKEHFTISKRLQAAVVETEAWWSEQAAVVPVARLCRCRRRLRRRHEAVQLQRAPPGHGAVLRRAADVRRPHPPVGQDRRRRRHRPVRRLRRRARDAGGGRPVALLPGRDRPRRGRPPPRLPRPPRRRDLGPGVAGGRHAPAPHGRGVRRHARQQRPPPAGGRAAGRAGGARAPVAGRAARPRCGRW